MKNNILYNSFIIGFIVLYIATALISLSHAVEFFDIGNVKWMSITLASVFELGQMVVLSSLLLSDNKKTLVPWMLLVILTCVQVIGNVYSVYKYISLSNETYYVYLQKSLIDWWLSGVQQETIIVIISWIIGALLPIIALFMTSMVANNIQLRNSSNKKIDELITENTKTQEEIKDVVVQEPKIETKTQESVIKANIPDPIREVVKTEVIDKKVDNDSGLYTGDIINAMQQQKTGK